MDERFNFSTREEDILLTLGFITSVEDYCLESELYGEGVEFIEFPILQEQFEEVLRVSMDENLIEENGQSYKVAQKELYGKRCGMYSDI